MENELKIKTLEAKKATLQQAITRIDKKIGELTAKIYGDRQYRDHVRNKHCMVCANRLAEHDFKIPDGIVCGHPSNQNGKDKFQCYSHTCQYWEQEKKDKK